MSASHQQRLAPVNGRNGDVQAGDLPIIRSTQPYGREANGEASPPPEQGLPGLSSALIHEIRKAVKEEVSEALRACLSSGSTDSLSNNSDPPYSPGLASPVGDAFPIVATAKPSVRFSDRGHSRSISKRPVGLKRAGSISESSSLAQGVLFHSNGEATPLCGQLFEALAGHLARETTPKDSLVLTPDKMAIFYERYPVHPEPVSRIAALFRGRSDDDYPDLERLYDALGCQYHLVREESSPRTKPRVPALTPVGFSRFMTVSLQAYPDEEFRRLQKATAEIPILSSGPASPVGEGFQLPSELIRSLFPAKYEAESRKLFDTAMAQFSVTSRQIESAPSGGRPRAASNVSFDPRRYVPGHVPDNAYLAPRAGLPGPRHSAPNVIAHLSSGSTTSSANDLRRPSQLDRNFTDEAVPRGTLRQTGGPVPPVPSPAVTFHPVDFGSDGTKSEKDAAKSGASTLMASSDSSQSLLSIPPPPVGGLLSFPALDPSSASTSPAASRNHSPDTPRQSGPMSSPASSLVSSSSSLKPSSGGGGGAGALRVYQQPMAEDNKDEAQRQKMIRRPSSEDADTAAEVQRHRNSLLASPSEERGPTWEEVLAARPSKNNSNHNSNTTSSNSASQSQKRSSHERTSSSMLSSSSSASFGAHGGQRDKKRDKRDSDKRDSDRRDSDRRDNGPNRSSSRRKDRDR